MQLQSQQNTEDERRQDRIYKMKKLRQVVTTTKIEDLLPGDEQDDSLGEVQSPEDPVAAPSPVLPAPFPSRSASDSVTVVEEKFKCPDHGVEMTRHQDKLTPKTSMMDSESCLPESSKIVGATKKE